MEEQIRKYTADPGTDGAPRGTDEAPHAILPEEAPVRAVLPEEFVRAGLSGCPTTETIGHIGWDRLFSRIRSAAVGGDAARLARETARLFIPEVWRHLLDMIRKGSVPAAKLYMELCRDDAGGEDTLCCREDGAVRALREEIFLPGFPPGIREEDTEENGSD